MLAAATALSTAQALTLTGRVEGAALGPQARVGLWLTGPAGAAGKELSSAPISNGQFSLSWPENAVPSRAQFALRPETIVWPGVLGDVQISAPVQSSAAALFVYEDSNGNAQRDDNELLSEAFAAVQRRPLVIVWVSAPVTVSASRGFSAALKSGWNSFTVDLGRSNTVSAYGGQALSLRVQR